MLLGPNHVPMPLTVGSTSFGPSSSRPFYYGSGKTSNNNVQCFYCHMPVRGKDWEAHISNHSSDGRFTGEKSTNKHFNGLDQRSTSSSSTFSDLSDDNKSELEYYSNKDSDEVSHSYRKTKHPTSPRQPRSPSISHIASKLDRRLNSQALFEPIYPIPPSPAFIAPLSSPNVKTLPIDLMM